LPAWKGGTESCLGAGEGAGVLFLHGFSVTDEVLGREADGAWLGRDPGEPVAGVFLVFSRDDAELEGGEGSWAAEHDVLRADVANSPAC